MVILCIALARSWSIRDGDISTAFLHALLGATTKHPTQTTIRALHQQEHLLETEEGDVWSQVINKSLARPYSKHHERTGLHTIHIRAQRAQASRQKGIHHGLCRRSTFVGETEETNNKRRCYYEQLVKHHQATQFPFWEEESPTKEIISTSVLMMSTWTTSSTRWSSTNAIHQQQQDQQQEKPSLKTSSCSINREHQQWSINNFDDLSEKLQWLAYTRPVISYATKELARISATNHQRPEESMTSGQVSYRDKRLQIQHQTNNQALWQDATTTRLEHLCRLRLGRMSSDKTKHNRLCHRATWHLHPPWIRNTRSGSLVISWSWILCHQHWSPRSAIRQELHHGSPAHQARQRAHPHR